MFIINNIVILFFSISLVLFIFEMLTPGTFFFFSFGIGSMISAISAIWLKNIPLLIIITAIFALISYLFLRKFDIFGLKKINSTTNIDSYIGKTGLVVSVSPNNNYRVKVFGEEWNAHCDSDLKIGDEVEITGRNSLLLYVKHKI